MNWTEYLKTEAAGAYKAAEGLFDLVDADKLDWKPATGDNWMTTGQLLYHVTMACGACCKGFVTGDWGMPEGCEMEDLPPEEMLPPAAKMPAVESVAQAKEMLAADKQLTFDMIAEAGEKDLAGKKSAAPWSPDHQTILGQHLIQMVGHLQQHKAQLFYYLKLQGKPVHTGTLWGM